MNNYSKIETSEFPPWKTEGARTTRSELIAMMMKRMKESPPVTTRQIVKEYEKLQPIK